MQSRLFFFPGPVGDNWNFNASNPCVYVGGNYNQNGNHGLFYVNYNGVSNANDNHGSRFLLDSSANNFLTKRAEATPLCYIP